MRLRRFAWLSIVLLLPFARARGQAGYHYKGDVSATGSLSALAHITAGSYLTGGTYLSLGSYPFTSLPDLSGIGNGLAWDATNHCYAFWNGSIWQDFGTGAGGGSVTSVGLATTDPWLSISGSPITSAGSITIGSATGLTANEVLATPNGSTGTVSLRALVAADLPLIPIGGGGTGQSTKAAAFDALSPMLNLGSMIYGGTGGTGTELTPNTTTTRKWLSSTGTGSAGNAPGWNTLASSDMPSGWPTIDQVIGNGSSTSRAVTLDGTITTLSGVSGHNGSGTNAAGAGLQFFGGQSTGTAQGGSIVFDTSVTGTVSGTSVNANQARLTINGGGTSPNLPPPSATSSLLQIGSTGLSGGSASGTYVGVNVPAGFTGDLVNYQKNGVSQFRIDNAGNVTQNAVKSTSVLGTDSNGKLQATTLPLPVSVGGTGAASFATASLIGSDASSGTAALRAIALGTGLSLSGATLNVTIAEAIGTMKPWPGVASTYPSGWLDCDGSAVSRTTYSGLWAIAQANNTANGSYAPFGPGDGSTTFNLPDTRGRMLVGTDASGVNGTTFAFGATGGAATNSVSGTTGSASTGTLITGLWTTGSTGTEFDAFSHPGNTSHTHSFTSSTFNQMNPYLVTNEIIKAQ